MGKRVLVIDDDEALCDLLEDILTSAGYSVEALRSPIPGAVDALLGEYDLITLDLSMPDMHGAEVAGLFKDQDLKTPVLVISGYLAEGLKTDLEDVGIRHMLPKPFTRSGLLSAVERAMAGAEGAASGNGGEE